MGQFSFLIGTAFHGACVEQPTNRQPSTCELVQMIKQCHINRIYQFPYLLDQHLQAARINPDVLATFCALDEFVYSGANLAPLQKSGLITITLIS
ncbi:hypothetical protein GYMLUDRAFT_213805, partial [Collybiopsis luxurians FD-317 M1]